MGFLTRLIFKLKNVFKSNLSFDSVLSEKVSAFFAIAIFISYSFLVFYKIDAIPGIFIDEANYMNEVINLAKFGTDIHGVENPVYFTSVWGQGQSVLYSLFVVPFVKLFGFSVLVFRAPFAILNLLLISALMWIINKFSNSWKVTLFAEIGIVSAPWIFISSRWLLDANVAPIIFLFGLVLLAYAANTEKPSWKRKALYFFSAIFIAGTAYGYVASWIYLPIVLILFALYLLKLKRVKLSESLIFTVTIFLIASPIVYFAYYVNIKHGLSVDKFLWFDIPPLPTNRASSMIDLSTPDVFSKVMQNVIEGMKIYWLGSDGLAWNSVSPFGAILPWLLPFTIIGLFLNKEVFTNKMYVFKQFLLISVIAFIPLLLVVTPNYNHWNLINIQLAIFTGLGLYSVVNKLKPRLTLIGAVLPILLFGFFASDYYFGTNGKVTFYNSEMVRVTEVQQINNFMKKHSGSKLFINELPANYMYYRIVQEPISHDEFLKIQDNDNPEFTKDMGKPTRYGYLYALSTIKSESSKGDYLLVPLQESDIYINDGWKKSEMYPYAGHQYILLEKES